MVTQGYIECKKTELSCKLAKLGGKYSMNLSVGKEKCAKENLHSLINAKYLMDVLCLIHLDEEELEDKCINNIGVKKLIKTIEKYLENTSCC
jgi:energy-converting hydrogenase A subunit M